MVTFQLSLIVQAVHGFYVHFLSGLLSGLCLIHETTRIQEELFHNSHTLKLVK